MQLQMTYCVVTALANGDLNVMNITSVLNMLIVFMLMLLLFVNIAGHLLMFATCMKSGIGTKIYDMILNQ